jgi:iron(III) transport system permease protein
MLTFNRIVLVCASLAVCTVLAPLMFIVLSWTSDQTQIWQHLIETQLSQLLLNTFLLITGVGIGVAVLGVSLAWLITMCEFPGRRWLDWALMLPLAVPAYVLAFVLLGLFDFGGPLQGLLHSWLQENYKFIDVRSPASVIGVMVLVLYPYVYMLARGAFYAQGTDVMEAARSLGCTPCGAFFKVALPMARPAIIAGVSLALMETLADFGTVAVFNFDTFTTAIYKSWFGFYSLQAGAQLASLLMLFVAAALLSERRARGTARYTQQGKAQHQFRYKLSPGLSFFVCLYCCSILTLAFAVPILQLVYWAITSGTVIDRRYLDLLFNSLFLAGIAAACTVALALLLAFVRRRSSRRWRLWFEVVNLGYAVPGSVLAVGIVIVFAELDRNFGTPIAQYLGVEPTLLVGSLFALLVAYWIRFVAVANGPVDTALARIKPSIPETAQSLGASKWALMRRIYLPMLTPGIFTALVLVFVDVMKEMPATLLLRPFGWDTLAVRVYEMTSEGEWQWAALPALTLVLAGLIPVYMLMRKTAAE